MTTRYADWEPTECDASGLALPDRQDWLVVPCIRTRDSGPLEESNFHTALAILGGESDTVEVHRFGHWGPAWFEIVLVHPSHEADAAEIEAALADYPVLDEDDFSEREQVEADSVWAHCYDMQDRINYIRKHRSQFKFRGFADLMGCVRGKYFAGSASELLS